MKLFRTAALTLLSALPLAAESAPGCPPPDYGRAEKEAMENFDVVMEVEVGTAAAKRGGEKPGALEVEFTCRLKAGKTLAGDGPKAGEEIEASFIAPDPDDKTPVSTAGRGERSGWPGAMKAGDKRIVALSRTGMWPGGKEAVDVWSIGAIYETTGASRDQAISQISARRNCEEISALVIALPAFDAHWHGGKPLVLLQGAVTPRGTPLKKFEQKAVVLQAAEMEEQKKKEWVEFTAITVEGDKASAVVAFSGDNARLKVSLAREQGVWKVGEVKEDSK